jgi:Trypsin/PEP-CTERM motif
MGKIMRILLLTASALVAVAATPALAVNYTAGNQPGVIEGSARNYITGGTKNGLSWQARNTIIGQTPTSDVLPPSNTVGGGNPIYKPSANKAGVVALIMEYANGDRFICSGSVLADGMSVATAGHCVSSGAGTANPVKTTAYFYKGDPDERTPFQTGGVEIEVTKYIVNENYTGEVIDQNDIAVLKLKTAAPAFATRYDLFTPDDLTGTNFNVAGYGTRSTTGGDNGNTAPFGARTGFLREGDNIYDYAWGNAALLGFFTDRDANGEGFFGFADYEKSYVSDFDRNGFAANSQSYNICRAVGGSVAGCAPFINNGVGDREVGIAGGDSGGPGFVDGKLASINSYGLTFGTNFGDFGGGLNSGWGEFSGYVPVYLHEDFINAAIAVPEPSSWAMLIAGFGLTGAVMRRRRNVALTA